MNSNEDAEKGLITKNWDQYVIKVYDCVMVVLTKQIMPNHANLD